MGFLYRVANSGGIGVRHRPQTDRYPDPQPFSANEMQCEALELKVWHRGELDPLSEGLSQVDGYLDRLGMSAGTLVIFDR